MKTCTSCRISKDAEHFYVRRASPDGLALICRPCAKSRARDFYARSKDRIKKKAMAWALANPERRREIAIKSAEKYIEKRRVSGREYQKAVRRADPKTARAKGRRESAVRRAREMQNGGEITQGMWDAIFAIFEFKTCLYCRTDDKELVMDHFIPVSAGGRTEAGNLLPCCQSCNSRKGAKMPETWLSPYAYSEISRFLAVTKEAAEA